MRFVDVRVVDRRGKGQERERQILLEYLAIGRQKSACAARGGVREREREERRVKRKEKKGAARVAAGSWWWSGTKDGVRFYRFCSSF